jgi:hypothetical protein
MRFRNKNGSKLRFLRKYLPYSTSARWMSMFKEGGTNIKETPALCDQFTLPLKKIVDKDARYTVVEISDIKGLSATFLFFFLESKVNVKEGVPPLDPAFAKFKPENGAG